MPCGGCGGNKGVVRKIRRQMSGSAPGRGRQVVDVIITGIKTPSKLVGAKTGANYGMQRNGNKIKLWAPDFLAAAPGMFRKAE